MSVISRDYSEGRAGHRKSGLGEHRRETSAGEVQVKEKGDLRNQKPRLFGRHFRDVLRITWCPIRVRSEEKEGIRSESLHFLFGGI